MTEEERESSSRPCSVLIDELLETTASEDDENKRDRLEREFRESTAAQCTAKDVDRLVGVLNGRQCMPLLRGWVVVFLGYVARSNEQQRDRIYTAFRERLHDPHDAEVVHKWVLWCLVWLWNYHPGLLQDLEVAYDCHGIIVTRARIINTVADLLAPPPAIHAPDAMRLLKRAVGNQYSEIRIPALRGLRLAGVEADSAVVQRLVNLVSGEREKVEESEGFGGTTELVTLVADLSQHERRLALEALGSLVGLESRQEERQQVEDVLERCVATEPDRTLARTAARALERFCGAQDAVERLIATALQSEDDLVLKGFGEGLREIDEREAVRQLKERLQREAAGQSGTSDDSSRPERRLLEEVGGREAVSWLLQEQAAGYRKHVEELKRLLEQGTLRDLEDVKRNMRSSHRISVWVSLILAGLGVVLVLVATVSLFFVSTSNVHDAGKIAAIFAGLGSLVAAFFAGPMRRVERSVIALTKATMATNVFSRQMSQIDTAFLHGLQDESMSTNDIFALLRNTASAAQVTAQMVEPTSTPPSEHAAPAPLSGTGQEGTK